MPLPSGAHVQIGERYYRLDESSDVPYRRFSRSIFADVPLVGSIGQNLQPGRLVWNQTNFDGEGQVVLDASDSSSARRFYRSTGLDFKTAGQFSLNRASDLTVPSPSGGTDTTVQGNAGFSDVTGTSTGGPTIASGSTDWTSQTSGVSTSLRGIAWSANEAQFVAVGFTGTIITSSDGTTWAAATSGTTTSFRAVARSENDDLWVAVGSSGMIYTSSNGTSWTSRTSGTSGALYGVARSEAEDRWVAVGDSGTILTSPDGTTWTSQTSGISTRLYGVGRSEADDLWVAVGNSGVILTSPDGTTWTSRTSGTTSALNAASYSASDDLWVVVGDNGTILTSSGGTTWAASTGVTGDIKAVVRVDASDEWVAVGDLGAILTSSDGTTWTSSTRGTTSRPGIAYASSLGLYVAVGTSAAVDTRGGSTTASTDRQLNAVNDVVKTTSDHTPGAYSISVGFHAYRSPAVNVADGGNPVVTFSVYNVTDSTTVTSQQVTLSSSSTASVATLSFTAATSKDYSYRVKWDSGTGYKPIVDKIVYTVPTSAALYTHQAIQLGQGGTTWVASSSTTSSTDTTTYTYDFSNNTWTNRVTPSSTADKKPLAMAHTDKYQYVLLNNSVVYQATTSAVNAYIAATTATARGIAITQNRLFVLGEDDTNGIVVYLYGIDQTSLPVAATTSVVVDNGKNTPDATLRQRMTSSPNGALFFVNYSTRGVVYECDASGASPVVTILAELPEGVKATSIVHTGGLTFVAAQFLAPAGKTPRSALFMIDQNRVIQRVGWFRRDDPDSRSVIAMQAYQNDLWMLQGGLVWRYSLTTGGLFLEHELPAASPSTAHGLAVTQDYVFAAYDAGVYVVGKLTNYLNSQAATLTSSVYDFALPYEEKLLQSIEVTTYQLPAGTAIKVEYQVDQNGVWVTAGTSYSGTLHYFRLSDAVYATRFHTLQIRTTPQSSSGTATPVVKGVTAQAYTTTSEQLFDLALLTTDQDSETTLAGEDLNGSDLAAYVWDLYDSGNLVTLYDGYTVGPYEEPTEYLCKIESIDHVNVSSGEGSVRVRLRVVT